MKHIVGEKVIVKQTVEDWQINYKKTQFNDERAE